MCACPALCCSCSPLPTYVLQLNGALVTDEEMQRYKERWSAVPDPYNRTVDEALKKQKLCA